MPLNAIVQLMIQMFFKVVLEVCAAAQRSGDHGWAEEDFEWQVSFVISKTFTFKYAEDLRNCLNTLFSSCPERVFEVQWLSAFTHHRLPRRSGGWAVAQCGEL